MSAVTPMNRCPRFVVEARCERQQCHTGPCASSEKDGRWHYAGTPIIPCDGEKLRASVSCERCEKAHALWSKDTAELQRLRDALDEIASNAEGLVKGGMPHFSRKKFAETVAFRARHALSTYADVAAKAAKEGK